jgi:hypothetical protein
MQRFPPRPTEIPEFMTTEHDEWEKLCMRDDLWVVRWDLCTGMNDT